jgi:small subunit ribosomal protein S6e
MKIVYSDPKTGRSAQAEVSADKAVMLINLRIGEQIDGAVIGLPGYKLKITGGSDKSGFPMNKSVEGTRKASVFSAISMTGRSRGQQKRKSARGNTTSTDIEQINTVIVEYGEKPISEVLPEKAPVKKEEKKEEKPAEAEKQAQKK